jgi:hypothetical protein
MSIKHWFKEAPKLKKAMPILSFPSISLLGIGSRIVVSIFFQQVDDAPNAQTGAQGRDEYAEG